MLRVRLLSSLCFLFVLSQGLAFADESAAPNAPAAGAVPIQEPAAADSSTTSAIKPRRPRLVNLGYRLALRSQLGGFMRKPFSEMATNRFLLDIDQNLKAREHFSAVAGVRIRAEGAYAQNPDVFSAQQAQRESSEVTPRDLYLQAVGNGFTIRYGYQQVVWGEAFGFFYADLVNPKDLREATLSGLFEQADLRKPIPLTNVQWMGADTTVQFIYSQEVSKHQLPTIGSPYSLLSLGPSVPISSVTVRDEVKQDNPVGDYGLRLSHRVRSYDFTLLGFSHIDRMPYYEISSLSLVPLAIELQERQKRVFSTGATMTVDFDGWLVRTELIRTRMHKFNIMKGTQLDAAEFGESIAVLGVDTPPIGSYSIGLQASTSVLDGAGSSVPLIRRRVQSLAGIRLAREFESGQSMELFAYANLEDRSSLTSLRWTFARSSSLEYLLGVESMQGHSQSQFGSLQEVSRIMVGLRGVFGG